MIREIGKLRDIFGRIFDVRDCFKFNRLNSVRPFLRKSKVNDLAKIERFVAPLVQFKNVFENVGVVFRHFSVIAFVIVLPQMSKWQLYLETYGTHARVVFVFI